MSKRVCGGSGAGGTLGVRDRIASKARYPVHARTGSEATTRRALTIMGGSATRRRVAIVHASAPRRVALARERLERAYTPGARPMAARACSRRARPTTIRNFGSRTRYRCHRRFGSRDRRKAHSRPERAIHDGARGTFPAKKSSDAPTPSITAGRSSSRHRSIQILLLGRAEGHEDQLRVRRADLRDDLGLLFARRPRVEAGGVDADDTERRKLLEHRFGRLRGSARSTAEKVNAPTPPRRTLEERGHEVGPRDPLGQRIAQQARGPYERHPVGDRQIDPCVRLAHALVFVGDHHMVDVRREHRAALPARDERLHRFERLLEVDRIDPHRPENERPPKSLDRITHELGLQPRSGTSLRRRRRTLGRLAWGPSRSVITYFINFSRVNGFFKNAFAPTYSACAMSSGELRSLTTRTGTNLCRGFVSNVLAQLEAGLARQRQVEADELRDELGQVGDRGVVVAHGLDLKVVRDQVAPNHLPLLRVIFDKEHRPLRSVHGVTRVS